MTDRYNELCKELKALEEKLETKKLSRIEKDELKDKIEKIYCRLAELDNGWY